MSGPTVVFRVDASRQLGVGHLMRCMSLAHALRLKGAQITFAGMAPTFRITAFEMEYQKWELPTMQDVNSCRTFQPAGVEWLVVDHYELAREWQTQLRPWAKSILAIDDLANRQHDADILLDQTLGRSNDDYRQLVPNHCRLLVGAQYALLRPGFVEQRRALPRGRWDQKKSRWSIIISMGGTDPSNATRRVLQALKYASVPLSITVVLGSASPYADDVRHLLEDYPHPSSLKFDAANMPELMANADMAVGGAGTTAWERCCLGLPSITIEIAANQKRIAAVLDQAGATLHFGRDADVEPDSFLPVFMSMLDRDRLRSMSIAASRVCDGEGASRVASEMLDGR